jgi:transposase-like protein
MGQGQGPKRWSATRARELLAEAKQSGESLSAFAQQRGIDPQRLYSWRRKLDAVKSADSSATREAFVPVRVASEARVTPMPGFELVLVAGRVVRVGVDFDARALRRLVDVLEEGSR